LLLPQTHANKTYSRLFCKVGNYLFKDFPQGGYVNLKSQTDKGKNDIALFISKSEWLEGGKIKGVTTDKASDLIGFLITVFYLSLTIATPVSWKRRIVALTAGFVLLTAFVMLKLYIIILYSYTLVPWFGLYQGTAEKESIQFWYTHLQDPPRMDTLLLCFSGCPFLLERKNGKVLIQLFRVRFSKEEKEKYTHPPMKRVIFRIL